MRKANDVLGYIAAIAVLLIGVFVATDHNYLHSIGAFLSSH